MLGEMTFISAHTDQWPDMTRLFSAHAAPRLWDKVGLGPTDMDVACI